MDDFQKEFGLDQNLIYLNHAAVAPWPQRTALAIQRFAQENVTHGAYNYPQWLAREQALKRMLAALLNAPSWQDIALLKNTSEGLSAVAYGLDWQPGDNIVISEEEFPSNRVVWESLRSQGVEIRYAKLRGAENPEQQIIAKANAQTKLIAVSSVQYGTGLRMDLQKIGRFCTSRSILFCVDAIQSLGCMQFDVQAINADFVAADAHKWLMGPEGIALFYCRAQLRKRLHLHQFGWHMLEDKDNFQAKHWREASSARRFECGSPNMLGIVGFHASLELLLEIGIAKIEQLVLTHSHYLLDELTTMNNITVLSDKRIDRYAGIVTFKHQTIDSDKLYTDLKEQNIFCAQRGGGIRISPHFHTPHEQLQQTLAYLRKI